MTATLAAVAARFRSQLGVVERPVNLTAYGQWYGPDGEAWCAKFVSWCFQQEDALGLLLGGRFKYTPAGADAFQKARQWQRTPVVGAVSFMDWGPRIAHVGWVEAVNPDGSWVNVEGNTDAHGGRTGGKVMRQRRTAASLGDQGGFGLVNYRAAATVPPAPAGIVLPPCPGVTRLGTGMPPSAPSPVTRAFQERLVARGYLPNVKGSTDGRHGKGTSAALVRLQAARGLTKDGVGGEASWNALWT